MNYGTYLNNKPKNRFLRMIRFGVVFQKKNDVFWYFVYFRLRGDLIIFYAQQSFKRAALGTNPPLPRFVVFEIKI